MRILPCFFIYLLCLPAFSQGSPGLKGGLNYANVKLTENGVNASHSPLIGFHIGLFFEGDPNKKITLQPEAILSLQGTKHHIDEKLLYVNVPILIKYRFVKHVVGYVGPQLGILAHTNEINGRPVSNFYNRFDLSTIIGLQYLGTKGFRTGIRYNYGIVNIAEEDDFEDADARNRVLQFYAGFLLD